MKNQNPIGLITKVLQAAWEKGKSLEVVQRYLCMRYSLKIEEQALVRRAYDLKLNFNFNS